MIQSNILAPGLFSNDAQSVNFREICMGEIAPKTLFRSSHPIKENKQEKIISQLAGFTKISSVINLSDTSSGITSKAIFAPWYNDLLKKDRVVALGMDFSFSSDGFKRKLKEVIKFILRTEGPWLIHCHAGVDRTGFVSIVLESFMGAPLDNVINDYLKSFNSGFESDIFGNTENTDVQTAMQVISAMSDTQLINEKNLQQIAEIYLLQKVGITAEEAQLLRLKLSGGTPD
ncbi:MAG: tyrosine-protein phosphatase [Treponema sp.]|nr:tyrosine-protein phosphatase [Treponema sp.]MCL2251066.1 tyrosine-protein phosphatase [Treponema sp.]MCL2251665.1 tyrosine-protein phosphatase [Treponema sp.]